MKNVPPVAPHFGPASIDFHLNRPVISLIQLHIVAPSPPVAAERGGGRRGACAPGGTVQGAAFGGEFGNSAAFLTAVTGRHCRA